MNTTSFPTSETPLGDLVTACPGTAHVLERLGLDYCCGGRRSLGDACAEKGLDAEAVLADLLAAASGTSGGKDGKQPDWANATLAALTEDIIATHHAFLRREIPRLTALLQKVVHRHGANHPELRMVEGIFLGFAREIDAHMFKEEAILFPAIREIERGEALQVLPCGSLGGPIAEMEKEHDEAGAALKRMRHLTTGFTPPAEACRSYRALLEGLAGIEADMHVHVHKENHILFPGALKVSSRLDRQGAMEDRR